MSVETMRLRRCNELISWMLASAMMEAEMVLWKAKRQQFCFGGIEIYLRQLKTDWWPFFKSVVSFTLSNLLDLLLRPENGIGEVDVDKLCSKIEPWGTTAIIWKDLEDLLRKIGSNQKFS